MKQNEIPKNFQVPFFELLDFLFFVRMSRSQWSKLTVSHRLSVADGEVNSVQLYTNDDISDDQHGNGNRFGRNRKVLVLAIIGCIVVTCCIIATLVTCRAAESMQIYAETFNNSLTCHVIVAPSQPPSLESNESLEYRYTVLNGTVSCPYQEQIVKDPEDLMLLEKLRREICGVEAVVSREIPWNCGLEIACFTNSECDEVFFKEHNSRYSESSHLFMVSASTAGFGAVTFIITLLIICFTRKDDQYAVYSKQWQHKQWQHKLLPTNQFTKYDHIIDAFAERMRIPEGIKEIIFDFVEEGNEGIREDRGNERGWTWGGSTDYGEQEFL